MGAGSHPTAVPKQLKRLDDMPDNPMQHWDDRTLKRALVDMYRTYVLDGRGGWVKNLAIRAMEDEMVERGISPVRVVENRVEDRTMDVEPNERTSGRGALADD